MPKKLFSKKKIKNSFWKISLNPKSFKFNELSPSCREVYQLSLHGKSHEEISQLLDISVNTVKKHKNNANHYMRARLKHVLSFLLYI
ncbi:RNA polymerase sigma factor [Butyricimonas virosa]